MEEGSGNGNSIGEKRGRWFCNGDDDSPSDSPSAKSSRSSVILEPKIGHPLVMLSLEGNECRLYDPKDDRIYETKGNFKGYRFLANSGKWFLVLDSRFDLYIIDVFSEKRITLPPLDSLKGGIIMVERVDDTQLRDKLISQKDYCPPNRTLDDLRGLLWVDDKTGDSINFVVVWQFENHGYLGYCKRGDVHYHEMLTYRGVSLMLRGQRHMVLKGHDLYIFTKRDCIRHLDLSGKDGRFEDLSESEKDLLPMWKPTLTKGEDEEKEEKKVLSANENILVTTSGEVLLVFSRAFETVSSQVCRVFRIFKRGPIDLARDRYPRLVEIGSELLPDGEALFPDLGVSVLAGGGIEPKCIYFTRDDRFRRKELSCLDICIYNVATKVTTRFDSLSNPNLKIKDAQWFIPS